MIWTIIQLVISGIAMGFVYALIGIEYTLIYNASGVLNFSHDKMVSLGAYIYAGMFVLGLGWNSMVSAIASLLLMAVFGILVAYLIFIPLRKQKSMIFTIMATIMFGKVIMEGACLIWGGNAFTIPDFMSGTYRIGNAVISKSNLFISTVICCCIGILVVPLYNVSSTMSNMIGLKGFAAGVLGGFGYMPGCIAGGLVLGIVENIASMILPSVYKDVVAFVLLVAFLLFRPQGLLGKKNK